MGSSNTDPLRQPDADFDFVVVGGGTSGSVIAARLAESPARPSVLLLEAGGANEDAAHLTGAERYEVAFRENSPLNWRYKTEPQWQGRRLDYSRGKGLGGSTAINFCGWAVGSSEDYEEWSRLVGDGAFGWDNVQRCLRKVENLHHDVPEPYRAYVQPRAEDHGRGGPVDLSYQEAWLPTTLGVFHAATELGYAVNPDVNGGDPIGVGIGPCCIYNGTRVTSASAYLSHPPGNLAIMCGSLVSRIRFEARRAVGVETTAGRYFGARRDVVVAAGAINSPQLLMLSGVGPVDQLEKHGIAVVQELPQVGRNLQDHCFSTAGLVIQKDHGESFQQMPAPMGWFQVPAVLQSDEFRALPRARQEFLRRPRVPSWEMVTHSPFFDHVATDPGQEVFSAICQVMNPQSRGTVTLRSADARDAPLIDPRFLTHPFDRRTAIEGMRELLRYLQAPVWKQRTARRLGWPEDDSDAAVWHTFTAGLRSGWHMAGTVAMGKDGDEEACVDTAFRPVGTQGLRVADMSVCPLLPSSHTQATAYVVGELAAERITADHCLGRARPRSPPAGEAA